MSEPPEVTILLLGDDLCGKSTFLSFVPPFNFLSYIPFAPTTPPTYVAAPLFLRFPLLCKTQYNRIANKNSIKNKNETYLRKPK